MDDDMDERESVRICQLIAGILVSDDELAPPEDEFVDRLFARFGLPPSARRGTFPILDHDEAHAALKALPAQVQTYALTMLIEAAVVDGKVVPSERAYLKTAAHALGVDEAEIAKRIDKRLSEQS